MALSSTDVHVWTLAELQALPEFGAENGWFYCLVEDEYTDSDSDTHDPWVLAEAVPGGGYVLVDRTDDVDWEQVFEDLKAYSPATFEARR